MSLEKIQEILHQTMGLHVKTVGSSTILHAVNERIEVCKLKNIEEYYQQLINNAAELKELIEEVVIPETWFFRDIEPFKMLIKYVKNEWLPSNPSAPLRVLSIPCASGEEPYSVAMALLDAGLTPSQIYIDGVDISQRNIKRCKEARYRPHSFRGVDSLTQNRFFRLRDDNLYHPDILIKAMVNFAQASILDAAYISKQRRYDVIFCRNLLIYFDTQTQDRAINVLEKLLTPKGLLFVGHAETGRFITNKNWNISHKYPKSFALRRFVDDECYLNNVSNKNRLRNKKIINNSNPVSKIQKPPISIVHSKNAIPTTKAETQKVKSVPVPDMALARQLADQGKFTEAESICLDSLTLNKQDADAYFLLAMIQMAAGDEKKSSQYLRNVIYLEPHNVDALMYLATLTEQQGDSKQAELLRQRAQRCKLKNEQQASI